MAGRSRPCLFSADTKHGAELCSAFQHAGIDFRQSTYRDSEDETRRMVNAFRQGDYMGLVSVDKFVKGFDDPSVLCGIDARPNSGSLAAVIQKMGRPMRSNPGKGFALWLDHAENMAGWYEDVLDVWENGVLELPTDKDKKRKRKEGQERADVVCGCGLIMPSGATMCPGCGKERIRRTRVSTIPGRMEEVRRQPLEWMVDSRRTWAHIVRLSLDRKAGDMTSAIRFANAQYNSIYGVYPPRAWEFTPTTEAVDNRIDNAVSRNLKRYWAKQQSVKAKEAESA